jgi:hypothetical protein
MYPFSHGLPGSMYSVVTPTRPSHPLTALAVNSGPLSDRMCPGTPRRTNRSASRSSTSSALSFLATSMARHSRVYSSITVSMRKARPFRVRAWTKS